MMSLKKSNSPSQLQVDATNSQPAEKNKKVVTIVLPDDLWSHIVQFVDTESLPALACSGKTTRDATVFRDVAYGSFLLVPTTKCHSVELAKKDGYSAYFQDLFAGQEATYQKWEGWCMKLSDIGMLKATRGSMTGRCCLRQGRGCK